MRRSSPVVVAPAARWRWPGWAAAWPAVVTVAATALLFGLGVTNLVIRATWHEADDGVLWVGRVEGVTAFGVAPGTPAGRAGIRPGDLLEAIDGQFVERPSDVTTLLRHAKEGQPVTYHVLRLGTTEAFDFPLASISRGNTSLYFVLAPVGLFTLLVGAAVRLRRPNRPATLHFLWLAVAFFGWAAFSFSGRLDRLDWFFYWADTTAVLLLPPLFLHFTFFFPERPRSFATTPFGSRFWQVVYLPALLLGAARVMAIARAVRNEQFYIGEVVQALDRFEPLYLSLYLGAGLVVITRAFGEVRTVTSRRQLRWVAWGTALGGLPFAFGYAFPYALGVEPSLPMELSAVPLSLIPLTFASAIVRYRLADVEVIVKRGLVWAAALAAVAAIYAVLLQLAWAFLSDTHDRTSVIALLATIVVVLVARPLKNAIQATFDRAFYRDRYDYRRALVGFARDLSSDLDLYRLGDRIVVRVTETLLVDRMALLLAEERTAAFVAIRSAGLSGEPVRLERASALGARLSAGAVVAMDDPVTLHGIPAADLEPWRERELYYFIPCVSKETAIAVLALGRKPHAEPLNSEDLALLAAVAGQAATALENGRLYRQLHVKAEELGRMREFNESVLESLDAGLAVVDVDERVVRWNRALEALHGATRAEAVGRTLDDLFGRAFVDAVRSARQQSSEGGTCYRFPLAPRASGDPRTLVNITTVPLQSLSGGGRDDNGAVIIVDDVTARAQLEEQLQISDKMASIGLLAAGVAHEVNTPLTGISSFTQMLLDGADPDDPKTRLLEKIERQTFRAAKIVNGLLNLSRPATAAPERARVDLNVVVNDVLSLLEHQFRVASIQVRRAMPVPGPVVIGTEFKLQQVFLNLFLNARDAMPKGGWLSVATRVADGAAIVEVGDTGGGIPSEYLARIYDPFFTTKTIGQGTGLGLSITYGIVREHDGTITCDSEMGAGTRFTLSFPEAAAVSAPRSGRAI
jgi:hypothetical protein